MTFNNPEMTGFREPRAAFQTSRDENPLQIGCSIIPLISRPRPSKVIPIPETMSGTPEDWASIKGASQHGRQVHPDSMDPIDLIVTGVVATDPEGRRLGKGGGYSDLEFALLREFDLIDDDIPILSTLHSVQELETNRIPGESQDITLTAYFTPGKSVTIDDPLPRPEELLEHRLTPEQKDTIPILEDVFQTP